MADATVGNGKVVTLEFTLTNDEGEQIDSTSGDVPLAYLHGSENVVPGIERALSGKSVGDKVSVDLTPDEGYGERDAPGPESVPRDAFPEDMELAEGVELVLEDDEGNAIPAWIVGLEEDAVLVDFNHPLAGMKLHFDLEILTIRDATEEEIEYGHPH
jgi:FKBP-type peptidyl-prolyl cis-trans isomerase SlyD